MFTFSNNSPKLRTADSNAAPDPQPADVSGRGAGSGDNDPAKGLGDLRALAVIARFGEARGGFGDPGGRARLHQPLLDEMVEEAGEKPERHLGLDRGVDGRRLMAFGFVDRQGGSPGGRPSLLAAGKGRRAGPGARSGRPREPQRARRRNAETRVRRFKMGGMVDAAGIEPATPTMST